MLNIFAGAKTEDGGFFNKLIVFDEAHKYITHSDLTSHVVEVIRQMRHQGVTMLIASQDPPSLPFCLLRFVISYDKTFSTFIQLFSAGFQI